MEQIFFELLQTAIGNRACLSVVPTEREWLSLFQMCRRQSLVGIAFQGVQTLPEEQRPTRSLVLQWYAMAAQIQQRNALTTEACDRLVRMLAKDGMATCILKGQANHRYYDKDLQPLRTCGDVDIWAAPMDKAEKHPVKRMLDYLYQNDVVESLCYLHAEVRPVNTVPVEVHLRPSFLNAPIRNRRFQKLFGHGTERHKECVVAQPVDGVMMPVLKVDYDVIFQLNHLYRHLLDEGVGLRQVLDYYMLLRVWQKQHEMSQEELWRHVKSLGMARFAQALMHVLHEVFAMPREWMICEASEKDGCFLLNEILQAGNFGQYDARMSPLTAQRGKTAYQVERAWRRFVRNLNFLTSYPEEVFWEPFARVEHLWWRKLRLWRWG